MHACTRGLDLYRIKRCVEKRGGKLEIVSLQCSTYKKYVEVHHNGVRGVFCSTDVVGYLPDKVISSVWDFVVSIDPDICEP